MRKKPNQSGVSLVELIFVLVIVGIITCIAVVSYSQSRKYSADDQARIIVDAFDEARQKALNQRNTMRVEINKTKNQIHVIDENKPDTATDDVIIRTLTISSYATIGAKPGNVLSGPTTSSPAPVPSYATSSYPLSSGDQKITLRFRRTGEVVDAGTDSIGTGSLVTGATIYIYSTTASGTNPDVIRAVTVLGSSGDTAIYKCRVAGTACGSWSR